MELYMYYIFYRHLMCCKMLHITRIKRNYMYLNMNKNTYIQTNVYIYNL